MVTIKIDSHEIFLVIEKGYTKCNELEDWLTSNSLSREFEKMCLSKNNSSRYNSIITMLKLLKSKPYLKEYYKELLEVLGNPEIEIELD